MMEDRKKYHPLFILTMCIKLHLNFKKEIMNSSKYIEFLYETNKVSPFIGDHLLNHVSKFHTDNVFGENDVLGELLNEDVVNSCDSSEILNIFQIFIVFNPNWKFSKWFKALSCNKFNKIIQFFFDNYKNRWTYNEYYFAFECACKTGDFAFIEILLKYEDCDETLLKNGFLEALLNDHFHLGKDVIFSRYLSHLSFSDLDLDNVLIGSNNLRFEIVEWIFATFPVIQNETFLMYFDTALMNMNAPYLFFLNSKFSNHCPFSFIYDCIQHGIETSISEVSFLIVIEQGKVNMKNEDFDAEAQLVSVQWYLSLNEYYKERQNTYYFENIDETLCNAMINAIFYDDALKMFYFLHEKHNQYFQERTVFLQKMLVERLDHISQFNEINESYLLELHKKQHINIFEMLVALKSNSYYEHEYLKTNCQTICEVAYTINSEKTFGIFSTISLDLFKNNCVEWYLEKNRNFIDEKFISVLVAKRDLNFVQRYVNKHLDHIKCNISLLNEICESVISKYGLEEVILKEIYEWLQIIRNSNVQFSKNFFELGLKNLKSKDDFYERNPDYVVIEYVFYFSFPLALSGEKKKCKICFEKEDEILLNCNHSFCSGCLINWLNQKWQQTCPLCRNEIKLAYAFRLQKRPIKIRKNDEAYILEEENH